MSSTSYESALGSINFTGGIPSSADLAPSIIFTILYVASIPLLAWRLMKGHSPILLMIRPCIFVVVRIATLILRAVMSKNSFGEGELIAELVLVSIGYLFLIDPVVALWNRHVDTAVLRDQRPAWVKRLASLMHLGLLAAIGTAIAGSALVSSALTDGSNLSTVIDLRRASACISLAVIGITGLAIIQTHFRFGLDARRTGYLLIPTVCLLIVAIYRVVQVFTTNPDATVRKLPAFWVLQITFEFLAYVCFIAININEWFPGAPKTEDVEMARSAQYKA